MVQYHIKSLIKPGKAKKEKKNSLKKKNTIVTRYKYGKY